MTSTIYLKQWSLKIQNTPVTRITLKLQIQTKNNNLVKLHVASYGNAYPVIFFARERPAGYKQNITIRSGSRCVV